jgi:hypothetical protein
MESTDLTQRAQDHGGFGQNRHGFGIGEGYKKRVTDIIQESNRLEISYGWIYIG